MSCPLRLGQGPSVLGSDRISLLQHNAGFEVSDFHAAFTLGAMFQPTSSFRALGPIEVIQAGSIDVQHALAVFDPLDLHPDETVATFARAVPAGKHDVFLSRVREEIVASLVRFRDAPVVHWTPALLTVNAGVCPRPPYFPMFYTRFAVSYADEEAALLAELPPAVKKALKKMKTSRVAVSDGFVAFDVGGVGEYASWFGENEAGEVVALATEYGSLRQCTTEMIRIRVSQALAKRVVLKEHDTAVSAALQDQTCVVLLELGPLAKFERMWLESVDSNEHQPVSLTRGRHEMRIVFASRPADSDVLRLDFQSVSRPLLHLEPASVANKLEQWHRRGLIAVAREEIPALAQRFCDSEAGEIREWLAEQPEVDEVFF